MSGPSRRRGLSDVPFSSSPQLDDSRLSLHSQWDPTGEPTRGNDASTFHRGLKKRFHTSSV